MHWTAATPRFEPWELRAKSTYGKVPGTSLIDWPISYEELKTYYLLAERRLGVTRRNDVPGLPASNNFKVMYAGAKKLGYKRVHTGHMAINSRANDGRGMCIQQGFCVQGCKMGAKWSTLYTEIPRAEATGNLDLRIECMATRIEHDSRWSRQRGDLPGWTGPGATTEGAHCLHCGQRHRDSASSASVGFFEHFRTASPIPRARWGGTTATRSSASSGESSTSRSIPGAARHWRESSKTK